MKLKAGLSVLVLTVFSVITANAQGLPCAGDDPDATCPLDSWVIALVVISSTFAAFTLLKKKKAICA